jgi:hypothetical protein
MAAKQRIIPGLPGPIGGVLLAEQPNTAARQWQIPGAQFVAEPNNAAAGASGAASIAGFGAIVAAIAKGALGLALLTSSGAIAASVQKHASGFASVSGTGSTLASGISGGQSSASVAGHGGITASAQKHGFSAAALSGFGDLVAAGQNGALSAATLTGFGDLTAAGTSAEAHSGTASLGDSGAIVAQGSKGASGAATLSGEGALTATGVASAGAVVLHMRRQIRDAIEVVLSGLATTGSRIYVARPEGQPLQADELPGLRLSTPGETIETLTMGAGRIRARTLQVQVELVVKSTGTPAATVDTMRKEIEVALDADPTLGGLASWVELRQISLALDASADAPEALGTLGFEALYHTAAGAPHLAA